jgi:hypothetical protein
MHRSTPRTAYELAVAQVRTPPRVVSLFWSLAHMHRERFGAVTDFGAADGRFATGGKFKSYLGIEIDPSWSPQSKLPPNSRIAYGCAFKRRETDFDACIGNPPYVRHHDIESPWKEKTAQRLSERLGLDFRLDANLYLYFMALAFEKTNDAGFVGLILPHEWISRPSASPLKKFIQEKRWNVEIYRFDAPIFQNVLTTASITFVDKATSDGSWRYFDVSSTYAISPTSKITKIRRSPLPYAKRANVWARRGISPGNQRVFVLREEERLRFGLSLRDVVPAVTSLRGLPASLGRLTKSAFKRYFVAGGQRCWLVKSRGKKLSSRIRTYLKSVPKADRSTTTCSQRKIWYHYENPLSPPVIFHSCFTGKAPKVVRNEIRAVSVGTTYGVFSSATHTKQSWTALRNYLASYPFRDAVIPHAHSLRKVEVRQLNHVLCRWARRGASA